MHKFKYMYHGQHSHLPLLCQKSQKVTVGLTWFDLFVFVTLKVVEFRQNNQKDGDREAWTGSLGLKWGP